MIIGSTAMKHWFPEFREPKDFDQFSREPQSREGDNFWHPSFPEEWAEPRFATVDELYTIKVSHSFWEIAGSWNKHMADVRFLQQQGAVFLQDMYDILYPVWLEQHGRKRTNLNQGKADFFNDAVVRKYDHDSIHTSVAYHDRPLYESILKDGSEVLTDWQKFLDMDYETQLQLVREEIYATALERKCIPSNYLCSPRGAYAWAIRRTATSLFKGKWALWLVLHYCDLDAPDVDYVQVHRSNSDRLILLDKE